MTAVQQTARWLCAGCLAAAMAAHGEITEFTASTPSRDNVFGTAVAALGDVNGDGITDAIAGAPRAQSRRGRAYVLDGATGAVLYTLVSPQNQANGEFGSHVAAVGDLDGDDVPEAIVAAPDEDDSGANQDGGRVYVFSGADGALLYSFGSIDPEDFGAFGSAIAAGPDLDQDETPDIVISAENEDVGEGNSVVNGGAVYLISGADGTLITTLLSPEAEENGGFGRALAAIPNLNGDPDDPDGNTTGELAIAVRSESGAPLVYVSDGATDEILLTLASPSESANDAFGAAIAAIDDVEGDDLPDIAVSAPEAVVDGDVSVGRVYIFSSADGALLTTLDSTFPEINGNFGQSLANAGDVNDNGAGDLIVGAPGETARNAVGSGRVYVLDGDTGDVIETFNSPNAVRTGRFGTSVDFATDTDGEGAAGLVAGAPEEVAGGFSSAGRAYSFAFGDGGELDPVIPGGPSIECPSNGAALSTSAPGAFTGDVAVIVAAAAGLMIARRKRGSA